MSEELQFDSSLGGKQDLPERLTLLYFTSSRAKEIQEMKQALKVETGTKMAFQRLPKHMRRRLMSHNVKRLPRRLREIHLAQQTKSGLPPKQKRPSRKYRRRPCNLTEEYARRQRKHNWLETHIWHAKRFHIVEKWGYRLPDRPCDKSFRACYRASARHCSLQDISYFRCVEISGPEDTLLQGFKLICDSRLGLTIAAKVYTKGNKEGEVMLFHSVAGLKRPVGPVNFHWKPDSTSENRVLWMWIHVAYYSDILNLLQTSFDFNVLDKGKFLSANSSVSITELELNRFRLTGPKSFNVLQNMLKTNQESANSWLSSYLSCSNGSNLFNNQCEYWNNTNGSDYTPNGLLALNVIDPRYNMPKSRTKPIVDLNTRRDIELPTNAAIGPIWEADIRASVKLNKVSNSKLDEMRSELLVPGTDLEQADIVPVMLIHRPGNRARYLGYGGGWDLVVPSGWGNTFWISLVMWGARAGGLREYNSIRFESGLPKYFEPDTQAGVMEEQEHKEKYVQRYFNLPPNKRPNYTKLGIIQPFSLNWKLLVQDWSLSTTYVENILILRDKSALKMIQGFLAGNIKVLDLEDQNYLIPVRLKMEKKGVAQDFAIICLPKPTDLNKQMVIEPLKQDANQSLRKEMRMEHKSLLRKLKRKRKQAKLINQIVPKDLEMLKNYKEKMQKLWLPSISEGLRTYCSRELMGYVTSGSFSYLEAKSCAVGYVTLGALKAIHVNKYRNKVLVRNIRSRIYRPALMEVVI